jgi:replicative DNA helicase
MLPRLSREAAEKIWTCPVCGLVTPIALAGGWYARRLCRCERVAFDARQLLQLQEELVMARTTLTYTWLGRAWSEAGLAAKTFATFRQDRQARAFAARPEGTLALYGSFGSGKCVAASEIITLSNGKRIAARELIGQEFEILTLLDGRPTPVKARAAFNALETVYQIETRSGRHVIRNGDHPFWTARIERPYVGASTKRSMHIQEWTPLRNIQVDDLIAVTTYLPAFPDTPGPLSDTEIRILAYLIGDGGYSRPSIRFSQQNNVQLDEFRACIEELGCSLVHHRHYDWRIVGRGRGPNCSYSSLEAKWHDGNPFT